MIVVLGAAAEPRRTVVAAATSACRSLGVPGMKTVVHASTAVAKRSSMNPDHCIEASRTDAVTMRHECGWHGSGDRTLDEICYRCLFTERLLVDCR